MSGPLDKEKPAHPGQGSGLSENNNERVLVTFSTVANGLQDHELITRPIRLDELHYVRRTWWRLSAAGQRLPAEPGLIVIDGGRR